MFRRWRSNGLELKAIEAGIDTTDDDLGKSVSSDSETSSMLNEYSRKSSLGLVASVNHDQQITGHEEAASIEATFERAETNKIQAEIPDGILTGVPAEILAEIPNQVKMGDPTTPDQGSRISTRESRGK